MISRFLFIAAFSALFIDPATASPSIKNLEELKQIQKKVNLVAERVTPATISLISEKNGASGSGVIVSESGLILTAAHVVQGAQKITVVFPNGKQADAKVLGANFTRDSAMVQITTAGKWPHVELGHSDDIATSDFVVALGHAGGYDPVRNPPVRFGRVISRLSHGFFNSDCALIGGDSGGPLFDLDGRLIGIHSSIGYSPFANNHTGVDGFRKDWKRLKRGDQWGSLQSLELDRSQHPVLGIYTASIRGGGVLVRQTIDGGPAAKAELLKGDLIHSINGQVIQDVADLNKTLLQYQPGKKIMLRIYRERAPLDRLLTLGKRSELNP